MPGEFYIEARKEKLSLKELLDAVAELEAKGDAIKAQVGKLAGTAAIGTTIADWNVAESDVILIGASDAKYKVHSLIVGIRHLAGTAITVRMYMEVNGIEQKVYEQVFDATADTPGLWIINGTVGIHDILRVTLQSNSAADDGKAVDYDYMLEEM